MKKSAALFCCAGSLLFLCACSAVKAMGTPEVSGTSGNDGAVPVSPSKTAVSAAVSDGVSAAAAPTPDRNVLNTDALLISNKIYNARDGINWYCYVAISDLKLKKEAAQRYPGLAAALDNMNTAAHGEAGDMIEKMSKTLAEVWAEQKKSKETMPSYFFCNYLNSDYSAVRIDPQAVCLHKFTYAYMGGAHGDYGLTSYNLDPVSGKRIMLNQIAADLETLERYVCDNLPVQYPNASFFDHQNVVHNLFARASGDEMDVQILEEHWSLTDSGIEFHFNPYELASYADGLLTLSISYKDHPELFNKSNAERYFCNVPGSDGKVVPLRPEHFSELLGKWRMTSHEIEGDIMDSKTHGVDCTLEIEKDGTAHFIYKQGDINDDCGGLRVKVENNAIYDGNVPNWCAALLSEDAEREFYVTVMPDGTLRLMMFTYMKDKEHPAVMMGTFTRM